MPDGSPALATESHRLDRRREGPVLMKREIKKVFRQQRIWQRLSIDSRHAQDPKRPSYRIFKVELEDMENGDRAVGFTIWKRKTTFNKPYTTNGKQ